MKLSGRKIILLTLLGVLVVGGLGMAIYYWRAKTAVTNYRKQLIAAGEKLTVKELIPPPPAKEEDGAELFHQVNAKLSFYTKDILSTNPPQSMKFVAPGRAMVGWQQPAVRGENETNTWDDLAVTLDGIAKELELLGQLGEKRTMDFKLNYHQGFTLLLPMLAPMKGASQKLAAAALLSLHDGDEAAATKHLRGMLGLARGLSEERIVISQLVRIAIANIAQAATWELLQSTNLTEAQLATIQDDWAALDFVRPMQLALEMERALNEMTIANMRESRDAFYQMTSGMWGGGGATFGRSGDPLLDAAELAKVGWKKTVEASREGMWRVAWSYPDQLRMLKGKQAQLEAMRMAVTNENIGAALEFQEKKLKELGFALLVDDDDFSPLYAWSHLQTLFSSSVASLSGMLNKVMVTEAGRQLTVTAIALKRHQLRHGNLPADLAALVPEFLPSVPLDPVNAQPLHYKPNADGTVLLYSVGEDAEDNGGDPKHAGNKTNSNFWRWGRDWVWPQPASAQEIEDFYQQKRGK